MPAHLPVCLYVIWVGGLNWNKTSTTGENTQYFLAVCLSDQLTVRAEVCCRSPGLRTAAGHLQGTCLRSGLFSCFVKEVETVVLLATHMPVHRLYFLKEEV